MLSGGARADRLVGAAGDDKLMGGAGFDALFGGVGDDILGGGAGLDRLMGGAGRDKIAGGAGADTFLFRAGFEIDIVTDFDIGADRLDFTAHAGVDGLADLSIRTFNGDAFIRDGDGGVLMLKGVDGDDLSRGDFVF